MATRRLNDQGPAPWSQDNGLNSVAEAVVITFLSHCASSRLALLPQMRRPVWCSSLVADSSSSRYAPYCVLRGVSCEVSRAWEGLSCARRRRRTQGVWRAKRSELASLGWPRLLHTNLRRMTPGSSGRCLPQSLRQPWPQLSPPPLALAAAPARPRLAILLPASPARLH